MYALCGCALLWSIQPLALLSPTHLPTTPYFSTAFSTHPYILYLHILCYAILLVLYHFFFFPSFPNFYSLITLCMQPLLHFCMK
jgi:hypothetical protein